MNRYPYFPRLVCRALLAALLLTSPLTAAALASDSPAGEAALCAIEKNGVTGSLITFAPEDFVVQTGGSAQLDAIIITSLPALSAGTLCVGDTVLKVGDEVAMSAVEGLRFTVSADPQQESASFLVTPVFSNGTLGNLVPVQLHLLSASNSAPIAENLDLSTYKNVAVTGRFAAVDPEGDLITYQLVSKPARGAVTMPEDGGSEFVYTPYENKTGKDSFTYVAVDAVGNTSAPATVKVQIEKADTKVTYADLGGHAAAVSAIRLAEEGVFVGECMGGSYFFQPDLPVTRGEFVAMAMNACGMEALEGVTRTGFADDASIPTWAKPYVSSALKAGLIQGSRGDDGQVVFQADSPITMAEAAVLLDRMLQISDVAEPTLAVADAPAWASQSAANLLSCGVIEPGQSGTTAMSQSLTRADAAGLLCGALDILEQREDGGWMWW